MDPQTLAAIRKRYPLLLFLALYLGWIFLTFQDYGMTFDESGVYARGFGLAHYLVHDDYAGFLHPSSPDDGLVVYDHLYAMALSWFNPSGDLDVYHFLNMLFASLVFMALFEVLLWRSSRPWLSALGPLFLFLMPRFSGDIPANPKDMPFAVLYFLSLTAILYFGLKEDRKPLVQVLVLGLLFGLTECLRLVAFSLYSIWFLYDLHFFYHSRRSWPAKDWLQFLGRTLLTQALVLIISFFILVMTWPYLGANFLDHLVQLLTLSDHFLWNNQVLFLGREVPAVHLPWTYLPVWLLLTTPLFILFFLGAWVFVLKDKTQDRLFILLTTALGVNLFLELLFKPVLYDGLRHFLFLLPILATLAAMTAGDFFDKPLKTLSAKGIAFFVLLDMFSVLWQLAALHPYEYIYFNGLIGGLRGAQGKMDNDYWGASFKEAVEWLAKNEATDPNRTYQVTGSGNPYQIFYYFPKNMKWVDDVKNADYYLSYTRDGKDKIVDASKIIHVVSREGVPLNYVFKLKP